MDPWGTLRASWGYLGVAGRSLGGSWEGPVGVFKCAWQLWKLMKNRSFSLNSEASEGPGGALQGPWGGAGDLGAFPRPSGEAPQGSLGGSREVGKIKVRILGRVVSTWGVFRAPRGALGWAQKAMSIIYPDP